MREEVPGVSETSAVLVPWIRVPKAKSNPERYSIQVHGSTNIPRADRQVGPEAVGGTNR
ncbi:hypothetical protein [Micromonospora kangleipakensis]|uniref:hypothetical protein n=1 Tax=Micromonospora kangleipakensis TaxID=1077942 RepID=UPI001F5F3F86|nr:hypothetical protein [Micromonospora kangleipakensis]